MEKELNDSQSRISRSDKHKKKEKRSSQWSILNLLLIVLGLLVLFAVCYGPIIFDNYMLSFNNILYSFAPFNSLGVDIKGPILSDPADNFYPVAFSTIHQLLFTSWIPQIGLGVAQSINQYLNPINYLYALSYDIAPLAISVTKVLIAFFSMYFLMRRYKYSRVGCFISGVSYAMSSTMVMWAGWDHSTVAMTGPLFFLIVDLMLDKIKVKYLIALSVVIFLSLVAGMPTYTAYFMYLLGCYVLFYGIMHYHSDKKKLMIYFLGFGVCVILGALMSLPYTATLVNSLGSSGYTSSRVGKSSAKLDWEYVRTLFAPYYREGMGIHANEVTLYTGILGVITLPLSLVNRKNKPRSSFYFVAFLVVFLLIFSNIFAGIYQHLPLVNTSLRFRLIVLANFCMAILVGANIDDLVISSERYRSNKFLSMLIIVPSLALFILGMSMIPQGRPNMTDETLELLKLTVLVVGVFVLAYFALVFVNKSWVSRVVSVIFVTLIIADMGSFGKNYLPLIKNNASSIPEATDTIKYLQKNSQSQEKFAALGAWDFFASANVYYNLRDIRGHSFVYTNADIKNYYLGIDPSCFTSPTRIAFLNIENKNLLRYMGVKYIVTSGIKSDRQPNVGGAHPSEPLVGDSGSLEQTFTATENGLDQIYLMVGTYGGNFTTTDSIKIDITDANTGKLVRSAEKSLIDQKDNNYIGFDFEKIQDSKDNQYRIKVTTDLSEGKQIAFYISNQKNYEGEFSLANDSGNLVLLPTYLADNSFRGDDGLTANQISEYSNQVQLTDTVVMENSEDNVLESMKNSYQNSTVFFSSEQEIPILDKQTSLDKDEKVTHVKNSANGTVSFTTNVKEDRVVLLNEYNDGNWEAYIDGNKTDVYKGNYLFRAIVVPAGEHDIVFKYRDKSIEKYIVVALVTVMFLLILFIFRKRIEKNPN